MGDKEKLPKKKIKLRAYEKKNLAWESKSWALCAVSLCKETLKPEKRA